MNTGVEEHVIYRVANAPLRTYPFPHFYIDHVFPEDFYTALRQNWPKASELVTLESTGRVTKGAYRERFIMPLLRENRLVNERQAFWDELAQWMLGSDRFLQALLDRFQPYLQRRFGADLENIGFSQEVLIVRDHSNYKLGPHTDAPHRVLSLLFYCPDDARYSHLGTSIYTPVDSSFRCKGGPHYAFHLFRKVATMEYRPNTLFAFLKTDHSFHGVDPIEDADVLRDLILYDIQFQSAAAERAQAEEPTRERGLGLRMLRNILRRQS